MTFPVDFIAGFNLVFIAFQQWQQTQVDSWLPFAERMSQSIPGFDFFEFPTLQEMNILARTFINEGMRAGIQDEKTRARTITLYLDKENFKRSLDIPNEDDIWTFLFDNEGQVLWHARGPFTAEKGEVLNEVLLNLSVVLAPAF